jgi:hypothetical protein
MIKAIGDNTGIEVYLNIIPLGILAPCFQKWCFSRKFGRRLGLPFSTSSKPVECGAADSAERQGDQSNWLNRDKLSLCAGLCKAEASAFGVDYFAGGRIFTFIIPFWEGVGRALPLAERAPPHTAQRYPTPAVGWGNV